MRPPGIVPAGAILKSGVRHRRRATSHACGAYGSCRVRRLTRPPRRRYRGRRVRLETGWSQGAARCARARIEGEAEPTTTTHSRTRVILRRWLPTVGERWSLTTAQHRRNGATEVKRESHPVRRVGLQRRPTSTEQIGSRKRTREHGVLVFAIRSVPRSVASRRPSNRRSPFRLRSSVALWLNRSLRRLCNL